MLAEGYNISQISYEEQGPLYNYIVAVGAGTTWTNERPIVSGEDAESRQAYGLREKMLLLPDVSQLPTLEMHARRALTESSRPLRRFGLTVLSTPTAGYGDYGLGDTVRLLAPSVGWGYDGKVRIMAREYDVSTGACRLAVDEERETQVFIRDLREEEQ